MKTESLNLQVLSLHDQLALQQLNHDFAFYLDHREVTALVSLFTEHAYYRHGSRVSQGRDEIQDLFTDRAASGDRVARHMISRLRLQKCDDRRATGTSVVTTWAANGTVPIAGTEPFLVADFFDEYELRSDGQWRISRREIERIFVAHHNSGPVGGK